MVAGLIVVKSSRSIELSRYLDSRTADLRCRLLWWFSLDHQRVDDPVSFCSGRNGAAASNRSLNKPSVRSTGSNPQKPPSRVQVPLDKLWADASHWPTLPCSSHSPDWLSMVPPPSMVHQSMSKPPAWAGGVPRTIRTANTQCLRGRGRPA